MKLEIATNAEPNKAIEAIFACLRQIGFKSVSESPASNERSTVSAFELDLDDEIKHARIVIVGPKEWEDDPFEGDWLDAPPGNDLATEEDRPPRPIVFRVDRAEIPDFLFPAIVLQNSRNTTCNVINAGPSADKSFDRLREKLQIENTREEIVLAEAMLIQAEWSIGLLYDLAKGKKFTTEDALEAIDPTLAPFERRAIAAISRNDARALESCFEDASASELHNFRFPGGHTLLHAVTGFAGAIEMADVLLRHNVQPNARALNGDSAVYAAAWGSEALALKLLAASADVTIISQEGNSPFSVAAWQGYDELAHRCLEAGAFPFTTDKDGGHPLIWAAQAGHAQIVSQIVEAYPAQVDVAAGEYGLGSDDPAFSPVDPRVTPFVRYRRMRAIDDIAWARTALMASCASGQTDIARYLLQKGANPSRADRNGAQALYYATAANDGNVLPLINLLHEYGADLNAQSHDGVTALMEAVGADRPAVVRELVLLGADPEVRDKDGFTPLHTAASFGRVSVIKALAGTADKSASDPRGFKPLHLSIFFKDVSLAAIVALVEAGADPNEKTRDGRTPLSLLLSSSRDRAEQVAIARGLIKAGADPWLADERGQVAVVKAAIDGFDAFGATAFEPGSELPPNSSRAALALICASALGRVDLVGEFVVRDVAWDYRASNGMAALDAACYRGREGVVAYIIGRGVDLIGPAGLPTPLTCAAERGHLAIVDSLLQAGADPNQPGPNGNTPLFFAAALGHVDVVQSLLKNGALVGMRSHTGATPLHAAAGNFRTDIARMLVQAGARTDVQDGDGDTPLHDATAAGGAEFIAFLLDNGVSPNAANRKRLRPLHLAARAGAVQVGELLLGKGADLDAVDINGDTALRFAVAREKLEFVNWLLRNGADMNRANLRGERPIDFVKSTAALEAFRLWGGSTQIERRLESERATFLSWALPSSKQERQIHGYWEEIKRHLISKLDRSDDEFDIASVICAPLCFYKSIYIAAISISGFLKPNQIFVLLSHKENYFEIIDWTNEPIYRINEKCEFNISNDINFEAYVKFFFFFVRGQLGRFILVDQEDQIDWAATASAQDKASVGHQLISLATLDDAPENMRRLTFTCVFKNALFKSDAYIALRPLEIKWPEEDEASSFTVGQIVLRNEELLLEELPINVPEPPGIFG